MQTSKQNIHRQNDTFQSNFFQEPKKRHLLNDSICGKKVDLDFNGGNVTSDAGALLLSEIEQQIGIIRSLSENIKETRRSYSISHSISEIIGQRVYQIACGYEDANDSNMLRADPAIKMAVGRLPQEGLDLASQPSISRLENRVSRRDLVRAAYAFVDNFIASYEEIPEVIVLDFDDTDSTVHGHQQMALFNNYYGNYCYMPLHVYEGISGKFITAVLRPGKRSSGGETVSYLKRIVRRIREKWADTIIVFRGDSHFSSPELFEYVDRQNNIFSITGLSTNNILLEQVQTTIKTGKALYEKRQTEVKLYHSFYYQAGSWSQSRKVVAKVELSEKGLNVRFISTDMLQAKARVLYENIYCARGNMELRIKDHKTYTKSDRSSCHSFSANQFRLFLHSAAYVLLYTLRTQLLKGTELANATIDTLRLKLLKLGARVVELKTKIKVHLPDSYPFKHLLKKCFDVVDYVKHHSNIIQMC